MAENIKILVVDDEPVIRSLFKDLLIDEGYQVEVASDGQEALAALKKDLASLVFMDVHMPVLNGLEALIEMRKLYPDISVVMMDSYPDQLVVETEKRGAISCIHKPFNIKEVVELIKKEANKRGL
jgi:CheY-like chemotaxis protein